MKFNKNGNALFGVLATLILFGLLGFLTVDFVKTRERDSDAEVLALQAKVLAEDIVELGKYYLSYERVVFLDDPLILNTQRRELLKELSVQGQGSSAGENNLMLNACGGYDPEWGEIGDMKVGGSEVFCPLYVRNATMSNSLLEQLYLKFWSLSGKVTLLQTKEEMSESATAEKKAIFKSENNGEYSVSFDLTKGLAIPGGQFLRLHMDPNVLQRLLKEGLSAKLKITFLGEGAGYSGNTPDRHVRIQSEVLYGPSFIKTRASVTDALTLYPSTLKDFSLFMMYPEREDGSTTTKYSEAVKVNGEQTTFNGKVFFNGDLDVPVEKLPTFNEVVIISGDFTGGEGVSWENTKILMKKKFKKGLIVRFPVKKLLNDGECLEGHAQMNQSGLYCFHPLSTEKAFTISDYIGQLGNICSEASINVEKGVYSFETSSLLRSDLCEGNNQKNYFVSAGAREVNVKSSHAFILSPVQSLKIKTLSYIYGTVLGGHVEAAEGAKFFGLSSLRVGMPGIADRADLDAITTEARTIQAGVGAPLLNLPFVKKYSFGR